MRKYLNGLVIGLLAALLLPMTAGAQGGSGGMLAVIGTDRNLSIYDADGRNPFPITTDADIQRRIYQMPTWSTDGRLAFFGVSLDQADPYSLRMFVVQDVQAGATYATAYTSQEEVLTYAYWSPNDCPLGNCRDLALLYTPAGGNLLAVKLIRDDGGTFSEIEVERGAPFYYSFAPNGKRMLWHRFGLRLELYDVESNSIESTLTDVPGAFQAPMWSPVAGDERLLFAVRNANNPQNSDLVIAEGDSRLTLLADQPPPLAFAWNADATQVAVTSAFGALKVLDASNGAELASSQFGQIAAHFWSPQGDKVAYLSLRRPNLVGQTYLSSNGHGEGSFFQQTQPQQLTWYVLDVATGDEFALDSFSPTREMIYFLNFFEQFARSHTFWSPDGRYLAYAAFDSTRDLAEVRLAEVRNGGALRKVADGVIGIWSWR
ncbi:MAG: hypothetical protein DYG88_00710 [Chloroflexi bacterium CFX4]|nr:hypothetical protein [Chloroflexi bacterium CFX4]MDL1921580.1 hypothetical protein [Chloroflexi bacterium CFX3]